MSRKMSRLVVAAVMVIGAVTGCVTDRDDEITAVAHGGPTVMTDQTSYTIGDPVTVTWAGMPGNQQDWVAITTANSAPDQGFVGFQFINGQTDGSTVFGGLAAGNYEARMYVNNTYQIVASTPFTVGAGGNVTVSTDRASYQLYESITVSWSGFPGNTMDWVSINVAGSGPQDGFMRYAFTGGQVSGSVTFDGLAQGSYEARGYANNTYQIIGMSTFVVATTTISTDKTGYAPNESITVTWAGLPGNPNDYVSLNTAGSAPGSGFQQIFMTGGLVSGSHTFSGLPGGDYEARAYQENTFNILASSNFVVSSASVTTDATSYPIGTTVNVSYTGLPGNPNDWIAVAPVGASDSTVSAFQFTGGAMSGTIPFDGLGAGTYEARAYLNNTFTVIARSTPFTILEDNACTGGGPRPQFSSVTSGDIVMDSSTAEVTVPMSVSLSNSILFFSVRENEPSPVFGAVVCTLHDADAMTGLEAGLTCDRNNAGTDSGSGTLSIHWSIATFSSGVTVQRGYANTGVTNPQSVSISSAPLASSFVILNGTLNNGSGWGNNEYVKATLTSDTSLDLRTNAPGTQVSWQVVTMSGASVQRGSASLASGDTDTIIPLSTTQSGTISMISYTTDNVSGIAAAAMMVQSNLIDPSNLLIKRGAGGSNIDVSWEVVSLPFATRSGVTVFNAGESSASEPMSGFSASTCVAVSGSQAILGQSGGSTTYAGAALDLVGEGAASLTMGSNSLSIQRGTSQASAEIPWSVIDFSRDCNGT